MVKVIKKFVLLLFAQTQSYAFEVIAYRRSYNAVLSHMQFTGIHRDKYETEFEEEVMKSTIVHSNLDFNFANSDMNDKNIELLTSIVTKKTGQQNWIMCLCLIDEIGNDIEGTEQCGPIDLISIHVPAMFTCSNFTAPNGKSFHFHLWLKKFAYDDDLSYIDITYHPETLVEYRTIEDDDNEQQNVVDLNVIYLDRLFRGSGYVVTDEGQFNFTLPIKSSSHSNHMGDENGDTTNIFSVVIDPEMLFRDMFTTLSTVVRSTINTEEDEAVLFTITQNKFDHILSHLSNIPICIPSSTSSYQSIENYRQAKILILGDSHSSLFFFGNNDMYDNPTRNFRSSAPEYPFSQQQQQNDDKNPTSSTYESLAKPCVDSNYQTCTVIGASAYGLKNKHSKTAGQQIFNKCIETFRNTIDYVGIMVGEVDIGRLSKTRKVDTLLQIEQSTAILLQYVTNITREFDLRMNQVSSVCVCVNKFFHHTFTNEFTHD